MLDKLSVPWRFAVWHIPYNAGVRHVEDGGPGGGVGYLVAPTAGNNSPNDTLVPATHAMRALLAR